MPDSSSMLTGSGLVADPDFQAPKNGTGTFAGWTVTQLLPNANFQTRGLGEYPLTPNANQGSMEAFIMVGALGTAQTVAFLEGVNLVGGSTIALGIGLDVQNRPNCFATDVNGTLVVNCPASGPINNAGTPLIIRFSWNAHALVSGGIYASLKVNGQLIAATQFSGSAAATWTPFAPTVLRLGMANTHFSTSDFAGTLRKFQMSATVTP